MIHYSCDRCNKTIDAREDIRYVVRIEVQLAVGQHTGEQLDEASLAELEKILEDVEISGEELAGTESEKTFDLCSNCYCEYINNPLAIEAIGIDFSKN